ncbi:MAG: ABC transporter substrate-binding protein [Candidatus Limnocylindrales bacterium]
MLVRRPSGSRIHVVAVPVVIAITVLMAACSPAATSAPSGAAAKGSAAIGSAASGSPSSASVPPTKLTVGLGYIPSVQFAAFYRADQAGYYAAEGLQVSFQNEIDANLVPKVGAGTVDLGLSDGTSVIPAVSQGIPIRYLATVYGRFPSIVFAKASSGITDASGLVGKKLGIPGKYGSSWIMLQALMASKQHTVADLTVVEYPDYGQGAALAQGAVDAATGFVNNEPVQLALSGTKVNVLAIDDVTPLPGPGIIAGSATIAAKHDAVGGFIRATFKAMNEIAADPTIGLDAAIKAVPELGKDRATQQAILAATIAAWRPSGAATGSPISGAVHPEAWDRTVAFMTSLGLVAKPVKASDLVDTTFVPGP